MGQAVFGAGIVVILGFVIHHGLALIHDVYRLSFNAISIWRGCCVCKRRDRYQEASMRRIARRRCAPSGNIDSQEREILTVETRFCAWSLI